MHKLGSVSSSVRTNSLNFEGGKKPEANPNIAVYQGFDEKINVKSEDYKFSLLSEALNSPELSDERSESHLINVTKASEIKPRVIKVEEDLLGIFSKALNNTSKYSSPTDLGLFELRFNSFYVGHEGGKLFTEDEVTNFQNDIKALSDMLKQHVQDNCEFIQSGKSKYEAVIKLRNASSIINQFRRSEAIRDCLPKELSNTLVECLSSFENSEYYTYIMEQLLKNLEQCKANKRKDYICETDCFPMPLLLAATKKGEDVDRALKHFKRIYKSAIKNADELRKKQAKISTCLSDVANSVK